MRARSSERERVKAMVRRAVRRARADRRNSQSARATDCTATRKQTRRKAAQPSDAQTSAANMESHSDVVYAPL